MSEDKERAAKRLRELEAEERHAVEVLREQLGTVGPKRGTAARIIAAEAAAVAYATAVDVVEGVAV